MTGWLFDTNILSELRRPKPEHKVLAFVAAQPLDLLYVSSATIAEIRFGIELVGDATDGGLLLLATLFGKFPFLEKLFADSAYQGPIFADGLAEILPFLKTEIIKRSDRASGFVQLPMICRYFPPAGVGSVTPGTGASCWRTR